MVQLDEVTATAAAAVISAAQVIAERNMLTRCSVILSTDHQLLLKQYEAVSASYSAEQEKTDALRYSLRRCKPRWLKTWIEIAYTL